MSLTVAVGRQPEPVCLVSGTPLTVTFDKSRAAIGSPGPWVRPPVQVAPPAILRVRSSSAQGTLFTAQLVAAQPGTATVIGGFDQECSSGETTPCTIPPQFTLEVGVTVVDGRR